MAALLALRATSISISHRNKQKLLFLLGFQNLQGLRVVGQFDSNERSVIDFPRDTDQQAPEALQKVASAGEFWRRHWIPQRKNLRAPNGAIERHRGMCDIDTLVNERRRGRTRPVLFYRRPLALLYRPYQGSASGAGISQWRRQSSPPLATFCSASGALSNETCWLI